MSQPRVSVIMGVYNCAATLESAVESVLDQDFRDFEFIICDDGSSDDTLSILSRLAERDPRIVVLANETNSGLPVTLNRCLHTARGEIVARMDGDDISLPRRFAAQVEFLQNNPSIGLCGSAIEYFDEHGVWGRTAYPAWPDKRSFLRGSPFAHPATMIRTQCLKEIGGYNETPSVKLVEDTDMFMRLYAAGVVGHNLQDVYLSYREDLIAVKRRTFIRAIRSLPARWRGFKALGLMPEGFLWAFKPVLSSLVPTPVYRGIRRWRFSRKAEA